VKGEETIYLPGYSAAQPQSTPVVHFERPGEQLVPTTESAPTTELAPATEPAPVTEQPMGDQPTRTEQVLKGDFVPIPTVEVRRFSAPHVEWEPSR
jgi:hypothetical protein